MCSGLRPTRSSSSWTRLPPAALGRHVGVDLERLADDVADRHPRVQRGVRVLEHDLDVAAQPAHRARPSGAYMSSPSKVELPGGRLLQAHQQPGQGRLAAAGLADDAERLALVELEGDPVDGLDLADRAPQHAALEREVLDQVLGLSGQNCRLSHLRTLLGTEVGTAGTSAGTSAGRGTAPRRQPSGATSRAWRRPPADVLGVAGSAG